MTASGSAAPLVSTVLWLLALYHLVTGAVALLALQLCRAFCRIRDRRLLADSLGVSPRRNAAAVALLGAESVVLLLALR